MYRSMNIHMDVHSCTHTYGYIENHLAHRCTANHTEAHTQVHGQPHSTHRQAGMSTPNTQAHGQPQSKHMSPTLRAQAHIPNTHTPRGGVGHGRLRAGDHGVSEGTPGGPQLMETGGGGRRGCLVLCS
ncbi:hypothetical protein KIL84_006318 [Mauremys mutica]|uniref:Uncharacterized protein n=1 Tax=Mauremys mutica TaxID=74926 RepID=A0A9D4AW25_9SAUR|nr:hypothetical protein KIL84_006318 [Mauremys mutica]